MPRKTFATWEAILKKSREQVLVVGKGDQAAADIAWWQDSEVAAQAARRSAVVGHGDHTREGVQAAAHFVLEAKQHGREASAAAEDDNRSAWGSSGGQGFGRVSG
jgi:hypothetical protein